MKITRIIIAFIKFITSISLIKVKVEIDVKKLICYNCNQVEHIKHNYFQLNKKTVRMHIIKMNNNDDDDLKDSLNNSRKD